jgi:hypothetical protein
MELIKGVPITEKGYVQRAREEDDRDSLINDATQKALERFDESMRELTLRRYREFEQALGPTLTRYVIVQTMRLRQQIVHRRAVFCWTDTARVQRTVLYAIQKVTTGGATHFPADSFQPLEPDDWFFRAGKETPVG